MHALLGGSKQSKNSHGRAASGCVLTVAVNAFNRFKNRCQKTYVSSVSIIHALPV